MQSTTEKFDLKAANAEIGNAIVSVIKVMLRPPGEAPDTAEAKGVFNALLKALAVGNSACAEVQRLQREFEVLREAHRPRPHANPDAAGALCDACSLGGALIPWPCEPWRAAKRILTQKDV